MRRQQRTFLRVYDINYSMRIARNKNLAAKFNRVRLAIRKQNEHVRDNRT